VSIDGVGLDYNTVERVDISLKSNEHDLAVLTLAGISPLSITDYIDRPIKVSVSVPYGDGFTFCGYINHIRPNHKAASGEVNHSPFQEAHLYCLGASSAMRGKKNKVWNDFTVLDMVADMAFDYHLSYSCPNSTPTIPRQVQRGNSDWEALVRACVQSGLSVNVHGTEIHVWSPPDAIRYGAPSASLTTIKSPEGASLAPGRIMEFDASFGTYHAYGDSSNESISLIDDTGMLTSASSDDLLGRNSYGTALSSGLVNVLPVEATSLKDARRKLAATKAYSDAFVATVSTTGVAGAIPGSAIRIDGFASEFDGVWLVRSMDMKFNRGHFITEFTLGRSSMGDVYSGYSPLDAYSPAPPPLLQTDRWKASLRRSHVYSAN
jgi:phage protein D